MLGSVGSNDWRGSLYEVDGAHPGAEPGTHIQDPEMKDSSYMGNQQNENTLYLPTSRFENRPLMTSQVGVST